MREYAFDSDEGELKKKSYILQQSNEVDEHGEREQSLSDLSVLSNTSPTPRKEVRSDGKSFRKMVQRSGEMGKQKKKYLAKKIQIHKIRHDFSELL